MSTLLKQTGIALIGIAYFSLMAESLSAQQRGPAGRGFGDAGLFTILRSEAMRDELNVSEDQLLQLREIMETGRTQMREQFAGLRGLPAEEREILVAQMREQMQLLKDELETQAHEILLPHQIDRLKQIEFQRAMSRGNTGSALASDRIAEELGLSEEQKQGILDLGVQVQTELEEQIEALRQEAEQKLLELLTPQQQERLEELRGDPFDEPARASRTPQRPGRERPGRTDRERIESAE